MKGGGAADLAVEEAVLVRGVPEKKEMKGMCEHRDLDDIVEASGDREGARGGFLPSPNCVRARTGSSWMRVKRRLTSCRKG